MLPKLRFSYVLQSKLTAGTKCTKSNGTMIILDYQIICRIGSNLLSVQSFSFVVKNEIRHVKKRQPSVQNFGSISV